MRRGDEEDDAVAPHVTFTFGPFALRPAERLLLRNGVAVAIGGRALDLLILLVTRAGSIVTHRELVAAAWPDVTVEESSLRVHLSLLRKTLGKGEGLGRYLMNVTGRGYSFVAPVATTDAGPLAGEAQNAPKVADLPGTIPLFGRDEDIVSIADRLSASRFVNIVGAGGLGKTSVAIAVAHRLAPAFADGIRFIDLSQITDPDLVATTVATELGEFVNTEDPVRGLVASLCGRRSCLVLDNCEHLVEAVAGLAARIFQGASSVHLLCTSREALRVRGEHIHLLQPLHTPGSDAEPSTEEVLASPAVRLFLSRAVASGHSGQLNDTEAAEVAAICRRLDGLALAIEIAAGRVGAYGVSGTAHLLDSDILLSWRGQRMAPPRQHSLRSMHDWSYNLLSEVEKRTLRRLSIFAGPFTSEAAHAVAAEPNEKEWKSADALASLAAKSLISVAAPAPVYYRLLATTRVFAAELLQEGGEQPMVAGRHARCQLARLGGPFEAPSDPRHVRTNHFQTHRGDVRKALEWAFSDAGDHIVAFDLAARAAPHFVEASLLQECRGWCERALCLDGPARSQAARLEILKALALSLMYTLGNKSGVRTAIERGLACAQEAGDAAAQLHFLAGMNLFLIRRGELSRALENARRFASVAASGEPAVVARAEWMVGTAHHMMGNQAAALRHCERGFSIDPSPSPGAPNFFGYDHGIRARVVLARTYWLRGHPDRALATVDDALEEVARCENPVTRSITSTYAACVFLWMGRYAEAESLLDRALRDTATYSLTAYGAVASAIKGECLVAAGETSAGISLLQRSLPVLAENHHLFTAGGRALAEGLARCGRHSEASVMITGAVARAREFGASFDLPDVLRAQAEILMLGPAPDQEASERILREALELARGQSALAWELRSAMCLARLWAASGRQDAAFEIVKSTYGRFGEGHATADLKSAAQLLAELDRARTRGGPARPRATAVGGTQGEGHGPRHPS